MLLFDCDVCFLKLLMSAEKIIQSQIRRPRGYIEDIQMFLLNMAFISSSEVETIYIS